jgi:hypothetical protein
VRSRGCLKKKKKIGDEICESMDRWPVSAD